MAGYEETFARLEKSDFRRKFHLSEKEKAYAKEKGRDVICRHAADFVSTRLAPAFPPNDGKQTPMRGHPVFVAQHATATCCRTCLYKWHRIEINKELNQKEQEYIIDIIMKWIEKEYNKKLL